LFWTLPGILSQPRFLRVTCSKVLIGADSAYLKKI
jgi:hypothetical protein